MGQIHLLILLVFLCGEISGQLDIGCFVHGECLHSSFVAVSKQKNPEDCLDFCKQTANCAYFTHHSETEGCYAFQNCASFSDTSCTDCISGQSYCEPLVCNQPGFCLGTEVDEKAANSAEDCLKFCKQTSGCGWFSFFSSDNYCILTEDCPDVQNITSCIRGRKICEIIPTQTHLMLAGGYDYPDYLRTVEIVDLSSNETSDDCGLPDLNLSVSQAFFIRKTSGEPMVCGGLYGDLFINRNCHYFDQQTESWIEHEAQMSYARRGARAVDLGNGKYWITGGASSTSEYYLNNEFLPGPQLPTNPVTFHCILAVEENIFFLGGHQQDSRISYLFYNETGDWSEVPSSNYAHFAGGCGLIATEANGKEIVIAGGNGADDETEIFNIRDRLWREGPKLPEIRRFPQSLQYDDSFLLIGGFDGINSIQTILKFDPVNEQWLLMNNTIQMSSYNSAAILLAKEEAGC